MLEPLPSRSVARFLLPMTDIMALLFSLFLLLPHLEQPTGRTPSPDLTPGNIWSPQEQQQVQEELARLRRLTRLPAHQRLLLVVLDIDGATGDLLLQEGGKTKRLAQQGDMDDMVPQHLDAARAGGRELYYVLRSGHPSFQVHPTYADEQRYRDWFGKWKIAYEITGARRVQ